MAPWGHAPAWLSYLGGSHKNSTRNCEGVSSSTLFRVVKLNGCFESFCTHDYVFQAGLFA